MKNFMNDPANFAKEMIEGVYLANKDKLKWILKNDNGVLHLINNYQGDRMDREMAKADDIKIGVVIIDDDVSVNNSTYTVGRRGVAANFFVIKAVGRRRERRGP
jgi:dihydroxyacetone kinase